MKVSNTQKAYNKKIPSFSSNARRTLNGLAPNFTYFFRNDFQWKSFAAYLNRKYNGLNSVNIYNAACSDGTEAFTLAISLISKLGKDAAKKFFPIKAHDINESLIVDAKSGIVPLLPFPYSLVDLYMIKLKTLFRDSRYMTFIKHNGKRSVKINDEIRRNIDFKAGNIFSEINNMERKNSVIMTRNMWMYLGDSGQEHLAKRLGERFDESCLVTIGEYDVNASRAVELLEKNGFEKTYVGNVFEKMK